MSQKDFNTTLTKIKSRGYWRVEFFPAEFIDEAIKLADIPTTMRDLSIQYRGWDYPHINRENIDDRMESYPKDDSYIESWIDWSFYKEVWRMHKQGKFIHLFAINEHWYDEFESLFSAKGLGELSPEYMDVVSITLKTTEIIEFIQKLATKLGLKEGYKLKIEILNVKDNELTVLDRSRLPLSFEYKNRSDKIVGYNGTYDNTALNDKEARLNFSAAIIKKIYAHFDSWEWPTVTIRAEQEKLLERKL